MATCCAKFIPSFSHLSEPLRKLTVKSAQFRWTKCEQTAFDNIKNALTSDTVMAYFDQTKPTELITDASPWGLSAILAQNSTQHDDRRIMAYVSRSLSEEIQEATTHDKTFQWLTEIIREQAWGSIKDLPTTGEDVSELKLFVKKVLQQEIQHNSEDASDEEDYSKLSNNLPDTNIEVNNELAERRYPARDRNNKQGYIYIL
ncbi:Hypothetical predicted protein [Paramuricea clavata]|uniref:Reverse transcriptase/retrotransposon-derived protein RNase H-like domain-containing protein n=1 Tax=Paramuricea clavata TaxID=317549 RepID=A0A7D9IZL0_PARCT|nr:Hypothetical predicted protein [Paramuricea clavata]